MLFINYEKCIQSVISCVRNLPTNQNDQMIGCRLKINQNRTDLVFLSTMSNFDHSNYLLLCLSVSVSFCSSPSRHFNGLFSQFKSHKSKLYENNQSKVMFTPLIQACQGTNSPFPNLIKLFHLLVDWFCKTTNVIIIGINITNIETKYESP